MPIALSFGTHTVQVTVGDLTISAPLTVAPSAPVASGMPVAQAFAPLGSNLRWVAFYDAEMRTWPVYDPSGSFSPDQLVLPFAAPDSSSIRDLTHIFAGEIYFVAVEQPQTVTLGGRSRTFSVAGANQVVW